MYSEEEWQILDKWRGKLYCSMHVQIDIFRECKKENVNFDEFINYAIQNGKSSWTLTIDDIKEFKNVFQRKLF